MKRILLTLALMLSILGIQAADITNISNAFKGGNASSLSASMDKAIDMALPNSAQKCNSEEAIALLNKFFNTNKPSGFTIVHHADKKESGFFVGKLATASGEYRVNITYRSESNKAIIQSIRIE